MGTTLALEISERGPFLIRLEPDQYRQTSATSGADAPIVLWVGFSRRYPIMNTSEGLDPAVGLGGPQTVHGCGGWGIAAGGDGAPYGIRTRVAAVKGRCPRPLDEGRLACRAGEAGAANGSV